MGLSTAVLALRKRMAIGDQSTKPTIGQIEYLNGRVLAMARELVQASEEPPVIIIFSDHGHRHVLDDRNEMFRSLLLSYRPGIQDSCPMTARQSTS